MRHVLLAVATTFALGSAAVPASAQPVQSVPQLKAPLTALQNGDLQTTYVQWRGRHHGHWGGHYPRGRYVYRHGYRHGYRYDPGAAAAAGVVGLATGAIIGGAIAQQQAAPVYTSPNSAVSYCMQRFRSYDPASGTYLGYDGVRHPCP